MATSERSGFGIDHPTVVPANFEPDPTDDESEGDADRTRGE
ncbi:hypothetical protein [Halosegnis sp.]